MAAIFRLCSAAMLLAFALAGSAAADDDDDAPAAPASPILGYRVRGHSKVTETTVARLCHESIGDPISVDDLPRLEQALTTSELFKSVAVTLEPHAGGVLVIATLDDKQSWIAAPTAYVLPGNIAAGAGYAENDLFGDDKKFLIYGQIGNANTFLFATYLDPSTRGTKFSLRFDLYLQRRVVDEFVNDDPRSFDIARTTTQLYLDGGALFGYTPVYWLTADLRLRGAYVMFRDSHAPDGTALSRPEVDGVDVSGAARITADLQHHRSGITWGPFLQLSSEAAVPVVSTYQYREAAVRASYSWTWFRHELELIGGGELGWHLPFQHEFTMGGAGDQRGYSYTQFRGDTRAVARAEYSVPVASYRMLAFRALAFWDSSYTAFRSTDGNTQRDYLANQPANQWWRNGVGGGFRVYVSSIVLPLVGFDIGYGLESHTPQFYLEIGLTDF